MMRFSLTPSLSVPDVLSLFVSDLAKGAVGTAAGVIGVVAILGMATALALPRITLSPAS